MRDRRLLSALAAALLLAAAPLAAHAMSHEEDEGAEVRQVDPGDGSSPPVTRAVAVLHPTEGHDARGVARFEAVEHGLRVVIEMQGLEPGAHGTHVHLLGDCTAPDGTSAGTHFNFLGSSKSPPADIDRITGDLGNVEAGPDGAARHEATIAAASLQGPFSILGRAVVVHAKPNDPGQPPIGAAGGRQACGVIGIDEE
ncbi:MAG: superoxide dismutase family protein [Myxococcota bacterium]|nr:superoxide dismutase family protein [Myxococcota bacterium]